ncbi:hypothetical protein [Paraburkholderia tagetis]|uniref:Uncharacterized protein n=1 Tax=Paraburkholderia tagetis TaxID=2913261 RepID=A0A9X1RUG9_9BURK|nr:hypothetical protein [Paraburkholderia tagetis]MCG5075169.1 hypothetical protein [Paraburkholderia tagetis]
MNWNRLYAFVQSTCVVWGASIGAGIFWAMVVTGLCRFAFKLEEKPAMLFIFCPVCIVLVAYWVRKLPARLSKAGMLSDDPSRFGPWFKN